MNSIFPDYRLDEVDTAPVAAIEPIGWSGQLLASAGAKRAAVLIVLAGLWEGYAIFLDNSLVFPRLSETIVTMFELLLSGTLPERIVTSLEYLAIGYSTGIVLAAALTILAISSKFGTVFLETVTAMLNPLPAIALLPLALIWFGLGMGSIIFVIVHSVLWAVALSTLTGFRNVSQTLRMVGRNYELRGLSFVWRILVPAAFPSILAGLKIGWAFAWRTLIAAELVFGVSSGRGGLGWFIFENRNRLEIPAVFAGLLTIILIGLIVEYVVFGAIESRTVKKWGEQARQ
jgi:NitT/TauT family transport system permease protein